MKNDLVYLKITSKIVKLFCQPGRLFFIKHSSKTDETLNSFSLEYLLLVQEKARTDVTIIPNHFRKSFILSVILLPIFILRFVFLFSRLVILNQIIKSYLNSSEIKHLLLKKYENHNT